MYGVRFGADTTFATPHWMVGQNLSKARAKRSLSHSNQPTWKKSSKFKHNAPKKLYASIPHASNGACIHRKKSAEAGQKLIGFVVL